MRSRVRPTLWLKRCALTLLFLAASCAHQHGTILSSSDERWLVQSESANWGVLFPVVGMKKVSEKRSADGEHLYAHFFGNNLNISVWMEPFGKCKDSVKCAVDLKMQDRTVKASEDVRTYDYDKFSVIEYFLRKWPSGMPPVEGVTAGSEVNQLNMTAFLFKDGYWIDVHLSASALTEDKRANFQKTFRTILERTQIVAQKS